MNTYKKTVISVSALSFISMSMGAITPALSSIAAAFPDAGKTSVAALATLPTLFSVPCALLSGRLLAKRAVSYRPMAILGLCILLISGVLPSFMDKMWLLIALRALMGAGLGLAVPIAGAVTLNSLERGAAERQMGINGLFSNLGAVAFQLAGGFLSALSWRAGFASYLLVLPPLIIILFNMEEPAVPAAQTERSGAKFSPALFLWCLSGGVFSVLFYAMITDLSGIITGNGYGTPVESALVFSVFSIGGIAGSYLFSRIIGRAGNLVFIFANLLSAFGYLLIYRAAGLSLIFAGVSVFGFGFGMMLPAVSLRAGLTVSPQSRPAAISMVSIFNGVGGFLSAYIFGALRGVFSSESDRFAIGAGIPGFLGLAAVFALIFLFSRRKKGGGAGAGQ